MKLSVKVDFTVIELIAFLLAFALLAVLFKMNGAFLFKHGAICALIAMMVAKLVDAIYVCWRDGRESDGADPAKGD